MAFFQLLARIPSTSVIDNVPIVVMGDNESIVQEDSGGERKDIATSGDISNSVCSSRLYLIDMFSPPEMCVYQHSKHFQALLGLDYELLMATADGDFHLVTLFYDHELSLVRVDEEAVPGIPVLHIFEAFSIFVLS